MNGAPRMRTPVAPVWRAELSCPGGGWLREVRRWACCGLRRTGGPSPELWGVFIIAVHRAFVLGLGAQHRGIVKLSEGDEMCVTVFASFTYLLTLPFR